MSTPSIQFVCPACGEDFQVSPQAVGHRIRCPQCNELAEVKPSSHFLRSNIEQTRELSAAEVVNTGIIEPLDIGGTAVEAPPLVALSEPEAPPVMQAPLARPAGPPGSPPKKGDGGDGPGGPPDPRLPKKPKRVGEEAEMDMTPMVDCVFQLLIFFMLTASFAVQKSLLFPKPTVDQGSEQKEEVREAVTVRIDAQSSYFVSGGALPDEVEAPSRQELIIKLKQARQPASDGRIPSKLMVLAHGDSLHERVVAAIDAGNDVGMEEVGLKTVEDEDQ